MRQSQPQNLSMELVCQPSKCEVDLSRAAGHRNCISGILWFKDPSSCFRKCRLKIRSVPDCSPGWSWRLQNPEATPIFEKRD